MAVDGTGPYPESRHSPVANRPPGAGINPATACLAEYPTEVRGGELFVRTPPASEKASES